MVLFVISLFLLVYFVFFTIESIKLKRNPRPKMQDNCKIRFRDVNKIKTQKFGCVESR